MIVQKIAAKSDVKKAFNKAHDDLTSWLGSRGTNVEIFKVPPSDLGTRLVWATSFAMAAAGVTTVLQFEKTPPGYGSWLTTSGAIILDTNQFREWKSEAQVPLHEDLQQARAVFHEVGHLQLSDILKRAPSAPGRAADAKPEEEELAWLYAFAALSMLAAAYSRATGQHARDDTTILSF